MQKGNTILVIDDQGPVVEEIAACLTDRGHRVLRAENGHAGLELLVRGQPDLVLAGRVAPELDSLALLRRVRETDPDKPFIVLSGTGRLTEAIEALKLGAWDYIPKPIKDMSVVLNAVEEALKRAHRLALGRTRQEDLENQVRQRTAALEKVNAHLANINTRLQKVVATTRGLRICADVAAFGATLLVQFADHMLASGGSLFVIEPDGLRLLHALDPGHVPDFIPFPLKPQSILQRVIQSRRPLLITDMNRETQILGSGWEGYPNGSALAFPLLDETDQVIGMITLHSKIPPPFIEQDKEIGTILASYSCETLLAARSMQNLRESEARFRELAEMLPEAVLETDLEMALTFANPRTREIFRYGREDLAHGFNGLDLFTPGDRQRVIDNLGGRTGDLANGSIQYTGLRKDGSTFPMLFHMVPINKAGRAVGYRGIMVDITDELALKDHLRQVQKMEAIGQLAGGIAHDLNNLLSPILGFSEMLLDDLGENDERRISVEEILNAGIRARDLVRKLLAFGRKQTLAIKPVNINTILEGFKKLLRRTIREDIEIEIATASDLPPCMADIGQIEQVIINLAINAADAMPNGGKVTFATRAEHIGDVHQREDPELAPGPYVVLTVSDTGHGMDEATCLHIFEPFFSTKGKRGTGLGLSTVYGIVKQHGGGIHVHSQVGQGTTFTIYLPVSDHAGPLEQTRTRTRTEVQGTATILLVEDNPQVRKMTHAILKRQGHTIIVAQDGQEALSALEAHGSGIHLMLTDVILPGMNGRELYAQAIETYPELKVLYMSGYSDDIIAHHGVLEVGEHFIEKPFSPRVLLERVHQLLHSESG